MSMTSEEYAIYIKNINKKKEEAEGLIKEARAFARSLFNQKTYTEYLALMSQFHRYSFVNVLLIQWQFASASYISGFDTWKTVAEDTYNNPSYQILLKKYIGKGIKILIPFTLVSSDNNQKERSLINFPVTLYDVAQTNKLPLPETDPLNIDIIDKYLMSALRSNTPYRFILTDKTDKFIRSGMRSYFDNVNQFIVIDEALAERERIVEYIRTWAKKDITNFIQQKGINESYSGFALSSVDFVVRSALSLNTSDIAFNYVSQYATANEDEFWAVLHCIQTVSHLIIERLTEDILDIHEAATYDLESEDTLFDFDFAGVGSYEV